MLMQLHLHKIKGMKSLIDFINRFSLETYDIKQDDFLINLKS